MGFATERQLFARVAGQPASPRYGESEGHGTPSSAEPPAPPQTPQTPPTTPEHPFDAYIWRNENRISSDGEYLHTHLEYLPTGAKELDGLWARVDGGISGSVKLNGLFQYKPQTDPKSTVTDERFDQVQLYSGLTSLVTYFGGLGFNMAKIVGESKNRKIVAHADAVTDMNAWFSPQDEEETYGTSDGKWNLASDNDVTRHETGHFIFYRQNPGLLGWQARWESEDDPNTDPATVRGGREGGAIHEGVGDCTSAFIENDAEVGEDFPPALGEPGSKDKGLRTVRNDKVLDPRVTEVHDRGEVYAGFFWSLKERLEKPPYSMDPRGAANAMARVMGNHMTSYATSAPKPVDFVKAVLRGTEDLIAETPAEGLGMLLRKDIIDEAIKRKMIKNEGEVAFADILPLAENEQSISALRTKIAGGNARIAFSEQPDQISYGLSGTREFYQQWTKTDDGKGGSRLVRVEGSGFFVFRALDGTATGYSTLDVMTKVKGEKGTPPLQFSGSEKPVAAVLGLVRDRARSELAKATDAARKTRVRFDIVGDAKLRAIKEAQKKFRIAEAAQQHAAQLQAKDAQLVSIPGRTGLYYAFKMGLSLYYVNAQSGATMIKEDVVWN